MTKALFLDMDNTLCDTDKADQSGHILWSNYLKKYLKNPNLSLKISKCFLSGIYGEEPPSNSYELPRIFKNENDFRLKLLKNIFKYFAIKNIYKSNQLKVMIEKFNSFRLDNFCFFTGVRNFLIKLRLSYKLIVITNGPSYSQIPKLNKVKLKSLVDKVIIGGNEPEQKPHPSIFAKALSFTKCKKSEVIHIGDNLQNDIMGAINFGIEAIWINTKKEICHKDIKPKMQVKLFTDLINFL